MADNDIKAIIRVQADTSNATKGMKDLAGAIASAGDKAEKSGLSIVGMVKSASAGFGQFNQAIEGVNKVFDFLNKSLDTAINTTRQQNLEKMLPVGTVDRFREATDKMIGRQDVLRLSVKGLTGDFKLTNDEMQTVLQTSVALSQKTGEHADVIADKLLDALAKGVNKLDDYGIQLDKTNDRQFDVNAAMSKFKDIIAENPVDEQTKSLIQMKDAIAELTAAMSTMITEMAKWAASAFRYGREFSNYVGGVFTDNPNGEDVHYDHSGTATAFDIQNARNERRDSMFGFRAGERLIGRAKSLYAEGQKRDQSGYWNGMSEEDYAAQFGVGGWDQDMGWGDTKVGKWSTKQKLGRGKDTADYATIYQQQHKWDYLRGGGISGSLGVDQEQGVGQVRPLDVVIMGIGKEGSFTLLDRAGIESQGNLLSRGESGVLAGRGSHGLSSLRYGGESFAGGAMGGALLGQSTGGYDANDPSGSLSANITKKNFAAGGAFDAGMAGAVAGMEAMITGQRAVGKAIASASAQALKAKAVEWGVFALGELAWGIADSAMLLPTAAGHFAAAAKFGAAAAAAGLGAAALGALAGGGGGGGASGASGVSAGGGYASSGGGSARGGVGDTYIINMGDGFYGDSDKTAKAVATALRQATRQGQRQLYTSTFSG